MAEKREGWFWFIQNNYSAHLDFALWAWSSVSVSVSVLIPMEISVFRLHIAGSKMEMLTTHVVPFHSGCAGAQYTCRVGVCNLHECIKIKYKHLDLAFIYWRRERAENGLTLTKACEKWLEFQHTANLHVLSHIFDAVARDAEQANCTTFCY